MEENKIDGPVYVNNTKCPKCESTEFVMKNYDMGFHTGDIHCANCNEYIREFDAG